MTLSVICPVYNEEKYIAQCIESILAQDYPKDDLEIIFADGMSTDRTREIVEQYSERYPFIKIVENPQRIVPTGLNLAISESNGDIIMRLDAHSSYAPNYFSTLVEASRKYDADNVGTVCRTDVLNKIPKALAIKEVLAHPLGVGNSTFRTGINEVKEVDTVPFGCWKRNVFERLGKYDERLVRNQDIEFSKRIINGGGKIVIVPESYCTYFARETFGKLARNNYANGKWNILTVAYTQQFKSLSLRHFIPLVFLLSLIIPLIVGLFWSPALLIALFSFGCYLCAVSYISVKLSIKKKLNFIYLLSTFYVLHISYGFGSLAGLLRLPFIKSNS